MKHIALAAEPRRKRQGIRAAHLRMAAATLAGFTDTRDVNLWATAAVAHVCLLRAGELKHLRHCDAQWATRDGRCCLVLHVLPIKKRKLASRVPIIIPMIGGPACPCAAFRRRLFIIDSGGRGPLGAAANDSRPLFRLGSGRQSRAASTADLRHFAKRIARVSGLPPKEVGGHSFRIGGATDMADYGVVAPTMLKTRGRWGSDIGYIYARDTIAQQFHAANAIYAASGETLESAFADWVQPARR